MLWWLPIAAICSTAPPSAAAIDSIVPAPKEIRAVGQPLAIEGFRIVAASDERSQIGAAEINDRIVDLGGRALPVVPLGASLPGGPLIVIAPCDSNAPSIGASWGV